MIKFMVTDLPVLLNVDVETYQIVLSVYFMLLFVGFTAACSVEIQFQTTVQRMVFSKLSFDNLPLVARFTRLEFSLGP
ncbi:MAG: hypothetical protein HY280_01375 [Nitrospinae bacterium]|nr:hypothetical protein [Nitrospinota bacterium]